MTLEKIFKLKKEISSKEEILRTAFIFINDYYIYLDILENEWIIKLKLKENSPIKDLDSLEGEFRNALLNESLRSIMTEQTKSVKEMIVARALYGADNSVDNTQEKTMDFSFIEDEMDNYLDDPLGIAVPWEEKHNKTNDNNPS